MDKKVQEKFDDLNAYVSELEKKVKTGTVVNIVVYSLIALLFLVYAIVIPTEVKRYTSVEDGPETLVTLFEGSLPSDQQILEEAKSHIPSLIEDGFDQLLAFIPTGESMFMDGMTAMTDELADLVEKETTPAFRNYLVERIKVIREQHPELSSKDAKKMFNDTARIHLRETLTKIMTDAKVKILQSKFQLSKFRAKDDDLNNKDLAEKRVILCFIRLCDDSQYRNQVSDALISAFEQAYGKFIAVK